MQAMLGAFGGWKVVVVSLFEWCLTGSIYGLYKMVREGKSTKSTTISAGEHQALGTIVYPLFGQTITNWYIGLPR